METVRSILVYMAGALVGVAIKLVGVVRVVRVAIKLKPWPEGRTTIHMSHLVPLDASFRLGNWP